MHHLRREVTALKGQTAAAAGACNMGQTAPMLFMMSWLHEEARKTAEFPSIEPEKNRDIKLIKERGAGRGGSIQDRQPGEAD